MSCMAVLSKLAKITRSDIRPYTKRAVSLVTAYGHFHFPRGFVWGMYGLTMLTLSYHSPSPTKGSHKDAICYSILLLQADAAARQAS